ncbi:DNA alkylation repair enzyme [Roseovarius sp. THAF9]|uniref:DNA alkylation repair protein n=1 Tax=Roseovarius sp. THAF9 TaxID=2587847 RepID=UPI0012682592|nr:DNA alkylation repair protein [Roseovarius sp. THAF9]QFT92660.1 DNA alkylation repair enzyme [Roseovarius sp. THAF9]
MTLDDALEQLRAHAEPGRAEGMADYHKVPRDYLGVPNPAINDLTTEWRRTLSVEERVALADALWRTNIFEARLAAAKLLTQARITPDDAVWALITAWLPDLDSWAIADHAMTAGQRRLMPDLTRMDEVETWTTSDSHWIRRAAMIVTLPLAKLNNLKPTEAAARERVLGWAAGYVQDSEWFIQKSVAWWLRDLSKHDPDRVRAFMAANGRHMKPFARKEAEKFL